MSLEGANLFNWHLPGNLPLSANAAGVEQP
jgi:hypothetical protein